MAPIAEVGDVEAALHSLAENVSGPFVVKLARLPGARDARWAHLLSGEVLVTQAADDAVASTAPRSGLTERVQQLEAQVASLQQALDELRSRFPT